MTPARPRASRTPRLLAVSLSPLALCLSSAGHAQPTPDAGTLLRQQEQSQRPPARLPEIDKEVVRPALKVGAGETVLIKSIHFSGATDLVPDGELQTLVADAIGRSLDFGALQQLTARVTAHLKSRGWFLARAYLPKQDLTGGNLEIVLLAGRLDGRSGKGQPFAIVPDSKLALRTDPARLGAVAAGQLQPGASAREEDIERTVLLMNDLPGISAKARLEPGTEADSTRILVDVEEGPLLSASLSLDNAGNRDTGTAQLTGQAQLNSPLGIGDQLSAALVHSEGLDLLRVGYSLPLSAEGTRLAVSATDMDYRLIRGAGQVAGLKGSSTAWAAALSHPILRSRRANLSGSLSYTEKALKDDSSAGNLRDKRVDAWTLGLNGDHFDTLGGGGLNTGSLNYTAGRLDLGRNAADLAADTAGYGSQGRYDKWNWSAARLQKLPGAFTAYLALNGQVAGKNLDSSEKFILGGPYGVRAYPGSEAAGDSGWLANLELRYDLPGGGDLSKLGNLQLVGFYDAGQITLHRDTKGVPLATATAQNSYGLYGWGLGVTLSQPGSHTVRLVWAHKLRDNPGRSVGGLDADSRDDRSRLWLSAALFF